MTDAEQRAINSFSRRAGADGQTYVPGDGLATAGQLEQK